MPTQNHMDVASQEYNERKSEKENTYTNNMPLKWSKYIKPGYVFIFMMKDQWEWERVSELQFFFSPF